MIRPTFTLPTDGADSGVWGSKVNASLEAAMTPGMRSFGGLRPVAFHAGIPNNMLGGVSNGTDRTCHTKLKHALPDGDVFSITLAFPGGWFVNGSSGESNAANDATWASAVELADGTIIPVFFNGKRRVTAEPGSPWVVADPIAITIKASDTNRYFFTRNRLEVPAAGTFYPNATAQNSLNAGEGSVRGTDTAIDLTLAGSIGTTGGFGVGPMLILGDGDPTLPILSINGDSIGNGTGDQANDLGFIQRAAVTVGVPTVKVTNSGGTNADILAAGSWRRRSITLGSTHDIHEGGLNDIRGGSQTAAAHQAQDIAKWRASSDRGAKVIAMTLTPTGVSSTDSFVTVENQTILNATAETARVTRNNWIRAGAPLNPSTFAAMTAGAPGSVTFGQAGHPAQTYFELADEVESARDSGKFKAGVTPDGLHLSTAKQITLAATFAPVLATFTGVSA